MLAKKKKVSFWKIRELMQMIKTITTSHGWDQEIIVHLGKTSSQNRFHFLNITEEGGKYVLLLKPKAIESGRRHAELFCEVILKYFTWEVHKGSRSKKLV